MEFNRKPLFVYESPQLISYQGKKDYLVKGLSGEWQEPPPDEP